MTFGVSVIGDAFFFGQDRQLSILVYSGIYLFKSMAEPS